MEPDLLISFGGAALKSISVEGNLARVGGPMVQFLKRKDLDGDRFTAGDLMMTTVLRILKHTDIVSSDRRLASYIERCTSRPAFKRALDAQIGDFRKAASLYKALQSDPYFHGTLWLDVKADIGRCEKKSGK